MAARITAAVQVRTGLTATQTEAAGLPAATAESIAVAAGDQMGR